MKYCSKCKESKPLSEFNKNSKRYDGLQGHCRECTKASYKGYYATGKEKDRLLKRNKEQYLLKREYVDQAKSLPCLDCGVQYPPYVMHFDHLGKEPKMFNISSSLTRYSLTIIKQEIAKCDVVCANCHAIRTHKRLHSEIV